MSTFSHKILTGIHGKKSINIHLTNSYLISFISVRTNPLHSTVHYWRQGAEISANILYYTKTVEETGLLHNKGFF